MTDPERIALAEEAHDLAIHVQMCAMRHAQILARINETDADARAWRDKTDADAKAWRGRIEKGVWALVVMVTGAIGARVADVVPVVRAMAGQ